MFRFWQQFIFEFKFLKKGGDLKYVFYSINWLFAWAKDQEINCQPSTYLSSKTETDQQTELTTQCKITLPAHANRTKFKYNDLLVPWKRQTDSFPSILSPYNVLGRVYMGLNSVLKGLLYKNIFLECFSEEMGNY